MKYESVKLDMRLCHLLRRADPGYWRQDKAQSALSIAHHRSPEFADVPKHGPGERVSSVHSGVGGHWFGADNSGALLLCWRKIRPDTIRTPEVTCSQGAN